MVTSGNPQSRVFDRNQGLQRCFGRREFLKDMVGSFLNESPELLARIQAAAKTGNASEVAEAAHRLKGTAAFIGADLVRDASGKVEMMARAGHLNVAVDAISRLELEAQQLRECLKNSEYGNTARAGKAAS